ncbi:MAG: tryptophan 7-halogenase, partial [Gammaproteobacteria bacterium]|nr:tryptophan 7-halogenase [Gammaproteobacteria bacterium]
LYAKYLNEWSQARGVTRTEGKVTQINRDDETGFIRSITLDDGTKVKGDLFIDCTGFRGVLINQTMGVEFRDWSHWLPVNRAWAVSSSYPTPESSIPPYTRARALDAGWQWRIPLQNRSGDGNVFCNEYISEERGREQLLENIEGKALNEPRLLKFTTGMREKLWHKNCVSIGLSAGFLEPLESTSIALIQATIMVLLKNFPTKNMETARQNEFNRRMRKRYEEARDFLILHYHATEREDTPFWAYCKNMSIPDELQHRIDLFSETGKVSNDKEDLFQEHNWLAVLFGQRIMPRNYDTRVNNLPDEYIEQTLAEMHSEIHTVIHSMPTHNQTLADYCAGDLISLIKNTHSV